MSTKPGSKLKPVTNGQNPKGPDEVLVQVQVTVQFAPLLPAGIGALSKPVVLTLDAATWNTEWATDRSREVFDVVLEQLKTQDAEA